MEINWKPVFLLISLFAVTYAAYLPGLSGGFLFDDFGNLPALGAYGKIDDIQTLLRFLTSGTADPTGRPVSLASFLIDARDWAAPPRSFKQTNLLIHLLNGLILSYLLLRIGSRHLAKTHAAYAAILGTGFWLLHPLLVSTTLYVIQRQAMLATTFVLIGLSGYLVGRDRISNNQTVSGFLIAGTSILTCTLLATLSKANGVLLPLLAMVMEYTIPSSAGSRIAARRIHQLRIFILGLPCALLAIYLLGRIPEDIGSYPTGRSWTYAERLLSQPRILFEYFHLLLLPSPYTTGLFNDQFVHSTGLLKPWTTLVSIVGLFAVLISGIITRRRYPFLALALLFFIAGHVLESGIIPLELYYEHRNYLPAIVLFFPLAVWLTSKDQYFFPKVLLATVLIAMLASMTYSRADLWGNQEEQAILWATLNPESPRAQAYAAQIEMKRHQPAEAIERLNIAIEKFPGEPQLTINLLAASCQLGSIREKDIALAEQSLETTRFGTTLLFKWLASSIELAKSGRCTGFNLAVMNRLLDAALRNPDVSNVAGRKQDVLHIKGLIALARGEQGKASSLFDQALQEDQQVKVALTQAAVLAQSGYPCLALSHLDHFSSVTGKSQPLRLNMRSLHSWILKRQGYWQMEMEILTNTINEDLERLNIDPQSCQNVQTDKSNTSNRIVDKQ